MPTGSLSRLLAADSPVISLICLDWNWSKQSLRGVESALSCIFSFTAHSTDVTRRYRDSPLDHMPSVKRRCQAPCCQEVRSSLYVGPFSTFLDVVRVSCVCVYRQANDLAFACTHIGHAWAWLLVFSVLSGFRLRQQRIPRGSKRGGVSIFHFSMFLFLFRTGPAGSRRVRVRGNRGRSRPLVGHLHLPTESPERRRGGPGRVEGRGRSER